MQTTEFSIYTGGYYDLLKFKLNIRKGEEK